MLGLILKDLLNLKKQVGLYALIIGVFIVISISQKDGGVLGGFIIVFCGMMPITALSYDERAKWERYGLTMPVSRTDMVISKYLLGVLVMVCSTLIYATSFAFSGIDLRQNLLLHICFFSGAIVFLSVLLPIMFKFGVEKGRILMLVFCFTPMIVMGLADKFAIQKPNEESLMNLLKLFPVVAIVIFALSMFISVSIYKNKRG